MTSKIKVDNINKVSDDSNIIKKCGTTVTVGAASDGVRTGADNLQAADGGNLISQSGTTITLGASGDTITLAAGASQTGFGRTGTVDWQTTPKTATFTAVSGEGYFANTTGSAFNMNLPAGTAGAIVSVADYAATWDSNPLTVVPNGSDKIGGVNANTILNTEGQSVTFVFVDSTQGWINTMDSTSNARGAAFITATGGTITTSGNCKIHTFTGPGTFTVCSVGTPAANNQVSYMVVAGGGGGGRRNNSDGGGGGGAGGFREDKSPLTPYTASPLEGAGAITVTATGFPITVGAGGTPGTSGGYPGPAGSGGSSTFSTKTSAGGGGGGQGPGAGVAGGSGGGRAGGTDPGTAAGNTPPVSPPQGNPGGDRFPGSPDSAAGGGGGATASGSNGVSGQSGNGGAGATTSITASPVAYSGGGAGGAAPGRPISAGSGGTGGGGGGNGCNGGTNTGGGAGASQGTSTCGGTGGSGIVVIRYKFQ